MAEIKETEQYKIGYEKLLEFLPHFDLSEKTLIAYLRIMLGEIAKKVEEEGKIPPYAYQINANLPILYDFEDRRYLEVMCSFDLIPEHIDDAAIDGSILIPKSASSRMDLGTQEFDVLVSWEELFLEN